MLIVLGLVGGRRLAGLSAGGAGLCRQPLSERLHLRRVPDRVISCFMQVAQLIRSVRWIEGFAGERIGHELVTPARAGLTPLATLFAGPGARGGGGFIIRGHLSPSLVTARSSDSVAQRHRRRPRNYPLHRQHADFPGASGHVLWPGHHRAGPGRDDPLAHPARRARGGDRPGRVRPPADGARRPAGRDGRGLCLVPCWGWPDRWSWACWNCFAGTWPEPVLPRARGMAVRPSPGSAWPMAKAAANMARSPR